LWISECLPETVLRRDEWYNDYLLRAGIDEAVGYLATRLAIIATDSHYRWTM
jgi:hypothetical protein